MTTFGFAFRFVGSEEWFASPHKAPSDVAFHAMTLHGGRIGHGPVERNGVWYPRARVRQANAVVVATMVIEPDGARHVMLRLGSGTAYIALP